MFTNKYKLFSTAKLAQVINDCSGTTTPPHLRALLADDRQTLTSVAAILSTSPEHLQNALDKPEPAFHAPMVSASNEQE